MPDTRSRFAPIQVDSLSEEDQLLGSCPCGGGWTVAYEDVVPLAGRWFGEPLLTGPGIPDSRAEKTVQDALRLLGLPDPSFPASGARLPFVRWMEFSATCFNEASMEVP